MGTRFGWCSGILKKQDFHAPLLPPFIEIIYMILMFIISF